MVVEQFENGSFHTLESSTLPAQAYASSERLWHHIFIAPETAESIGLIPVKSHLIVELGSAPNQAQLDQAWAELGALVPGISNVSHVRDPSAEPERTAQITLMLAYGITLAAGMLALGLDWVESRRVRLTLWTLGASSADIRVTQAGQVWLLTTVAALLGTVSGLVPAVAMLAPTQIGLTVPWGTAITTVIGFPLLFAAAAAALLPSRSTASAN